MYDIIYSECKKTTSNVVNVNMVELLKSSKKLYWTMPVRITK